MHQPAFIFSNQRKHRLQRHVAFWVFWAVFQAILYAFVSTDGLNGYLQRLPLSMLDSLMFLPIHIFLSYALMYLVIPFYVVKGKYLPAFVWTCVFILATAVLSALISLYLLVPIRQLVLADMPKFNLKTGIKSSFVLAVLAGFRGGLTIGGSAAAIKLMKHWYVAGQRNLELQKENMHAQLQVLKAQVHPHFLFNTLNNIYAQTQYKVPEAAKMLMGLADMLRYMLYECDQPVVPLAKELRMIEDYIGLEQIRYGNKLEVHVAFPDDTSDCYIAPLLLLPFVENCFKHGISRMLEQPWLTMQVTLEANRMHLKLVNSKPHEPNTSSLHGIGIENVRRRLTLLYPNRYELHINDEAEIFIVNLKLELERRTNPVVGAVRPAALPVPA